MTDGRLTKENALSAEEYFREHSPLGEEKISSPLQNLQLDQFN